MINAMVHCGCDQYYYRADNLSDQPSKSARCLYCGDVLPQILVKSVDVGAEKEVVLATIKELTHPPRDVFMGLTEDLPKNISYYNSRPKQVGTISFYIPLKSDQSVVVR